MGFYLRRSMKIGPGRVNLSKSGLGFSFGVTGARVAVGPRGIYTHGGRHGLYYRSRYHPVSTSPRAKSESAVVESADAPGAGFYLFLVLLFAGLVLLFVDYRLLIALLLVTSAGYIAYAAYHVKCKRKIDAYTQKLSGIFVSQSDPPPDALVEQLRGEREAVARFTRPKGYLEEEERKIYAELLRHVLEDHRITREEAAQIRLFERVSMFDPEHLLELKKRIFHAYYVEFVSDHKITDKELATLRNIFQGLGLPREAVEEEVAIIHQILRMQALKPPLQPIPESPVKLQRNEQPYYAGTAKVMRRKKAARNTDEYVFTEQRSGTFVITDKRAIVVSEGTTTVRVNDVLDVDVDIDALMIIVTRGSASTPIYIECEEALYAGRILSLLADT